MNHKETPSQWQSLEERAEGASAALIPTREFLPEQEELKVEGEVGRRHFMGLMGATMALTGAVSAGCIRKPKEKILPYATRPEDMLPGESRFFASSLSVGGSALGLLVSSFDGRPTKVEGNPDHPNSLGATNHFAQAEVLNIYDPTRLKTPSIGGQAADFSAATEAIRKLTQKFSATQGRGLAILTEWNPSPTYQAKLAEFSEAFPSAKIYLHDEGRSSMEDRAMRLLGLPGARVRHSFENAAVVVAIDSDFLGLEGEVVRHSKEFSRKRRLTQPSDGMSRLYCVESHLSVTGSGADHRLLLPHRNVGEVLVEIAREIDRRGARLSSNLAARLGRTQVASTHGNWIRAVVDDLLANQGRSLVTVGDKQPEWVHGLAIAVNDALGNVGNTLALYPDGSRARFGTLDQLSVEIKSGLVAGLMIVGGNPAYGTPGDLGFADLISRVVDTVYLGFEDNETAAVAKVAIPRAHGLESWGDTHTLDGTIAIRQPLIAPLYDSWSELEFLNQVLGAEDPSGYKSVREVFSTQSPAPNTESAWSRALHDGVVSHKAFVSLNFDPSYTQLGVLLRQQNAALAPTAEALDLVFIQDHSTFDGRYSNNAWLQELPDPLTKITWDNALLLSPRTAEELGLQRGDLVEATTSSGSLVAAVFVQPGVAPHTGVISMGYGRRRVGPVGTGTGFDVAPVRSVRSPYVTSGVQLKKTGQEYALATTQGHQRMEGRPIVRENTLKGFEEEPRFVEKYEMMPLKKHKTNLWKEPNVTTGQQWGMTIDLNACTGCNTCVVACQSENNVAIVGKEEVIRNREMPWIRVDRYFTGGAEDPQVVVQPVNCMHCETAPCEQVCPVGATIHSPEGTNDMAYNRCIGTRYCANNCPYKVRRFNYFNFSKRQDEMNPLISMQQNPNVTVRFRGVIEKCTYCIQRINKARIEAKRDGDGFIADGTLQTACQQACPTDAIEFGDINDKRSRVARAKAGPRNYGMLGELNTRPRTTYLAKIRNPHSKLV